MQTTQLSRDNLRRLAELRPEGGRVLSVFLNLDPTRFATRQARSTEVQSLMDEAERRLRSAEDLSHHQRTAVRDDVDRLRRFFNGSDFDARGAHAMAVFCAGPADLFEVIKLPRPVESRVIIDDSPAVEPLADLLAPGRWAVLLVNRRIGRLLSGSRERMEEVQSFRNEVEAPLVQGGGGSQSRDDRADAKEAHDHVRHAVEVLFRRSKRAPFDALLVGGPRELQGYVEENLHPYLRDRLVGHIEVDVENSTPEQVHSAAAPLIEEAEGRRERDALDRLAEGLGRGGRGAAGLADVLSALNERRVEILLVAEGFSAAGVVCRGCGWVGPEVEACPVDGGELERRDDVIETAVELALGQSAEIIVPHHHDDLSERGGIGAVLRF